MLASAKENERQFKVEGMDCGSCVQRIQTALGRIVGVEDIGVNMTTETLTASIRDDAANDAVIRAVKGLGYKITPVAPRFAHGNRLSAPAHQDHDHCDHDHSNHEHSHNQNGQDHADHGSSADDHFSHHAADLERSWWQSAKGKLVIGTGALLAAALLTARFFPWASSWIFLVACLIGVLPIARRAFSAARHGSFFTIEMLMTVATVGALAIGAAEEAAVVVFLFAVGELLETVAAGRARAGIKALSKIAPTTALVETVAGIKEVPTSEIAIGETVVVRPGDRIPADGVVISGSSSVDESALTGESMPRLKEPGDPVFAGSINADATLRCKVEKPATETLIARVVHLVEQAVQAKAPTERFIDRFSRIYMPAICLLAVGVAVVPPLLFSGAWETWIYRGLTLLLIGCPCALVISTPAAIASALAAGARRGLLVKGGAVLEAIGSVQTIAFDKTGTLTEGRPQVTDVMAFAGNKGAEILRVAAAVESTSSHPLAAAILARANEDGIRFEASRNSSAVPGQGVKGRVGESEIFVAAAGRMHLDDLASASAVSRLQKEGKTVSVVLADNVPLGLIAFRDEPRKDAASALHEIAGLGVRTLMLTGDNAATAEAIGKALGMQVFADLLPEDKLEAIKELAEEGGVAVVGDGINDAPALAAANVGIAMGSGTDVALETADAAILRNRVKDVGALVRLSRRTMGIIYQNITIALGLKAVFLLTTIVGFTGLWLAILADTGATVLVTANALRLLRTGRT